MDSLALGPNGSEGLVHVTRGRDRDVARSSQRCRLRGKADQLKAIDSAGAISAQESEERDDDEGSPGLHCARFPGGHRKSGGSVGRWTTMSCEPRCPVQYVHTHCNQTPSRRLDWPRNSRWTGAQASHSGKPRIRSRWLSSTAYPAPTTPMLPLSK